MLTGRPAIRPREGRIGTVAMHTENIFLTVIIFQQNSK